MTTELPARAVLSRRRELRPPEPAATLFSRIGRCTSAAILATLAVEAATIALSIDFKKHEITYITKYMDKNPFYDGLLYEAVADRVRAGEGYYDAAVSELSSRGYQTSSVFNVRTPPYALIFGRLPSKGWGRAMLLILLLLSTLAAGVVARRFGALPAGLAAAGYFITCGGWLIHPWPYYFMEMWCGMLVFVSAVLVGRGHWMSGVAAATVALALRELTLPYIATLIFLASRDKKPRVLIALSLIIITYLVLYYIHYLNVVSREPGGPGSQVAGWLRFGGLEFVLSTCRMNFVLAVLPPWCAAVYLPLAIVGLIGWRGSEAVAVRITAFVYLAILAVAGKWENFYWGWMTMPLLYAGALWSPAALRDLLANVLTARD